jgi:hypothetical protein
MKMREIGVWSKIKALFGSLFPKTN